MHREDHGRSVNKKVGLAEIQRVSGLFYRCGASMVVDSDSCEPIFFLPESNAEPRVLGLTAMLIVNHDKSRMMPLGPAFWMIEDPKCTHLPQSL